ncbi:MAG: cell surface protein SprA, partial [Cytophagales bacterium]|nr:cell surface protein SprA [Cytophagales bacterium]
MRINPRYRRHGHLFWLGIVLASFFMFSMGSPLNWGLGGSSSGVWLADTLPPYVPNTRPELIWQDRSGDGFSNQEKRSPFYLKDAVTEVKVEVDTLENYRIYEYVGELLYRPPSLMNKEVFGSYENRRLTRKYWKKKLSEESKEDELIGGRLLLPPVYVAPWFSEFFGSDFITFHPNILMTLDASMRWERIRNPAIPINRQSTWTPNIDPRMNANITGQVGEKLKITFNYDTQTPFAALNGGMQNNFKLEFTGFEEDIIKKIEIGDVNFVTGNSLIRGSESLFGVKTRLQFGKLFITQVFSNQRGAPDELRIREGSQGTNFTIEASLYDENRHFFLGHFFRDHYEKWLSLSPQITSGINITRIEVYVLNRLQA